MDNEIQQCFEDLKEAITSTLILALPNFASPFTIEADASQTGVGVIFMQSPQLVTYFSQALFEKNQYK